RNYVKLGTISSATNGGRNFWLGNNPNATWNTGNGLSATPDLRERLQATPSEAEKDFIQFKDGLKFIWANPARAAALYAAKWLNFWRLYPRPSTGYKVNKHLAMLLSILSCGLVLGFALIGLRGAFQHNPDATGLLVGMILCLSSFYALFFTSVRFRMPIDPLLMIFATHAVASLWQRRRESLPSMHIDMKDRAKSSLLKRYP
ncbi:MAG: hypothetical protein D6814_14775, partial [Calditrichaeota bacterium]